MGEEGKDVLSKLSITDVTSQYFPHLPRRDNSPGRDERGMKHSQPGLPVPCTVRLCTLNIP